MNYYSYFCNNRIRHASHKNSEPGRVFLLYLLVMSTFRIYTKQALSIPNQIALLKNRGLQIDDFRDIKITNSRKIVDAHNYIIHGYDSLSADILWSIVINHLPLLKSEIKELLQSEG